MKKIVVIALILAVLALLAVLVVNNMKRTKYEAVQLTGFSIVSGGGMDGSRSEMCVRYDESCDCVSVYDAIQPWHDAATAAECHVAEKALLDEIKQIVLSEKLYHAPKAPWSPVQALDASTTTYSVSFSDGEYFQYSSGQQLSDKVYRAHDKIKALIDAYSEKGTSYPTVYAVEEADDADSREESDIFLRVINDEAFGIAVEVYHSAYAAEDVVLRGNVVLSKLDGDKTISSEILEEDLNLTMSGGSWERVNKQFKPEDYPTEGRYKVEYAGYETTFEMKAYTVRG